MYTPNRPAKSALPVFLWIICAFVVGIALWAAVYRHTNGGEDGPRLLVAVGSAGLALAFGGILGGIVKKLFDAWDDRKTAIEAQNAYYAQLLEDFKTVYNTVERSRFLITAHKSAKTYGERMRTLPDAVILLHNVKRATQQGFPDLYKGLEGPIFFCNRFLKGLIEEYRDHYLEVSRLQSQDEADNKLTRDLIAEREPYQDEREISHSAWARLLELPHLGMLIDATDRPADETDNAAFESYEKAFVQYIDLASYCLMLRMPGSDESLRNTDLDARLQACRTEARALKAKRAKPAD
ncbi:hypothetical protein [Tateyamaria sp. SN3-11]|uniref:hypothetical protein n=1 Tax=Tateyamaria sp. SN3-11 TaxID=3092147 RepID=UPI0039E82BA7